MNKEAKIYVAGHNGMVGSAIVRKLKAEGHTNILTASSKEVNLINQAAVNEWFEANQPDYVFVAAARVGGINANNVYRADFLYENLMIECNVIHAAFVHKVKKLLFLGSTCIYPKMAPQPLKESYLLSGVLEETNETVCDCKNCRNKIVRKLQASVWL
jgi:GDP-L-fucose synthase